MTDLWDSVDAAEGATAPSPTPDVSHCVGCPAPCCWSMKLMQFEALTWHDLDYVHFLSGFPAIDIVYAGAGRFRFFYRRPCRHLDPQTFNCRVHGTAAQPQTCVEFDEAHCFYRQNLLGPPGIHRPSVRLDHSRWLAVAALFVHDAAGNLIRRPEVSEAVVALAPLTPAPSRPPLQSASADALLCVPASEEAFWPRINPCATCAAPCCRALLFDRKPPTDRRSLGFMRYQLGFPGVEIVVSPTGWRTLVRTSCRFLDATLRCTLFGQPERPTLCSGYNPWRCDYRRFFSPAELGALRLDADAMDMLLERAPLDAAQELPKSFGVSEIREMLRPSR